MKILALSACACMLALSAPAFAQPPLHPLITAIYPPPQDVRQPDLTIPAVDQSIVRIVSYDADGRLLATAGTDNVIRLWEARPGEQGTGAFVRSLPGHTGRIWAIGPGTAPNTLVSIAADRTVRTWDETSGAQVRSLPLRIEDDLHRIAIVPGKDPILATWDGTRARLMNYETGELVNTLDLPASNVWALAFSATHIAAGFEDGSIKMWLRAELPAHARTFQGHSSAVHALAFDPRGEQLASASADRTVKVWDVAAGTLLCSQEGHAAAAVSVAFASNGQKMASGGSDGTARLWTVPLPPIPPASLEKIRTAVSSVSRTTPPQKARRILVFWRADAILHKSGVPAVNHALELMSTKTRAFEADFSRDFEVFDPAILARYDAIVMNSTAHLVMTDAARRAYLDYVRSGGGVIAIHAAIDTFLSWTEGAKVVGATFGDHPWVPTGTWGVKLEEPQHPLLRAFAGRNFTIKDEFYVMGEPFTRADRRVLLAVDLSDPASAGVNLSGNPARAKDHDFALSWIKHYGQGRVFYADFGHIDEPFWRPEILQFYLDGIQYVLGDLSVDDLPKNQ